MRPSITTRDGRIVALTEREAVIAELLLELRAELSAVHFGNLQFDLAGPHVTAHVTTSRKGRPVQMRAGPG